MSNDASLFELVCPCAAPSAPPSSVVVKAPDSRLVNITWGPPPSDAINGIISHYVVNMTVQDTKERFHYTVMDTKLIVDDLHPYYTYTVVVAAFTVRKGPFSVEFSITAPQDGIVHRVVYSTVL